MSKFQNRLKRLHASRIRALEESKHEEAPRVFMADDVAETVTRASWKAVLGAKREDGYTILERRFSGRERHGRYALEAAFGVSFPLAVDEQIRLFSAEFHASDIGYFDIESDGLSKDCVAFCLGLGAWDGDDFVVRQFAIEEAADECAMLEAFAQALSELRGLVSFNGRSFDVPRLAARYAAHGLADPFTHLEHVDLLHAARRFFPRRKSLTLQELERAFVMFHRHGDVPGSEAPRRWRAYVESGHLSPAELGPLFDHNRLDILSLVSLLVHFDEMVSLGKHEPEPPEDSSISRPAASQPAPSPSVASRRPQTAASEGSLTSQLKKTYRLRGKGRVVRHRRAETSPPKRDESDVMHVDRPAPESTLSDVGTRLGELRREAMALLEEHRFDEALPILHAMVSISPRNPYPVAQLARYYRLIGDESLAELFEARLKGLAPY